MIEHEILEVAVSLGGKKNIWKLNLAAIWCGELKWKKSVFHASAEFSGSWLCLPHAACEVQWTPQEEADTQLGDSFNSWLPFLMYSLSSESMNGYIDAGVHVHTFFFYNAQIIIKSPKMLSHSVHMSTDSVISMTIAFFVQILYYLRFQDFIEV